MQLKVLRSSLSLALTVVSTFIDENIQTSISFHFSFPLQFQTNSNSFSYGGAHVYLPSHVIPRNVTGHRQTNCPAPELWQVPEFWQGFEQHTSKSIRSASSRFRQLFIHLPSKSPESGEGSITFKRLYEAYHAESFQWSLVNQKLGSSVCEALEQLLSRKTYGFIRLSSIIFMQHHHFTFGNLSEK